MVLGATAAAAAAAGGTLFEYNRKNFLYDRKMRQETEYQIMDFRIKQAQLWREDVKDIIGLTSVKMDTYLIVNAVQLGFCVMAFCEGRLAVGTPVWLIGCHTLSLAGAFMYLLMSVWLSMHASVTAKSYEVRLLTQLVRLPVPSWAQLEGARTYSSGFEKTDPKQMFRVPFVMGTQEAVLETSATPARAASGGPAAPALQAGTAALAVAAGEAAGQAESADVWGLERRGDRIYELDGALRSDPHKLRHLRLVEEAMRYWQSYDGFARVAMSVGTNQLVAALSYYVIGYVLISNHAVIAAWLVVMLFMVVAAALIRLDMSLTGFEYRISVILIISGPCLTAVSAEEWSRRTPVGYEVANLLAPIAYAVHALWLMFLLYISNVREQKGGAMLPTGFRSVMYIDVFGWIRRARSRAAAQPSDCPAASAVPATDVAARVPGIGPAVQAVRYEHGEPVPSRPEELPGAAQSPFALEGLRKEDFEPTTFVPREKDSEQGPEDGASSVRAHARPGFVPWRLFCSATVLLIALWWISGVFVLLTSCGIDVLKVAPLLREAESHEHGHAALVQLASPQHLTGGELISTSWPSLRIQPRSLSCSDDSSPMVVSASHFGIFTAEIGDGARQDSVKFEPAPACESIEGESLQDVTLSCGKAQSGGICRAFVLHRQGERLSTCRTSNAVQAQTPARNMSEETLQTMLLADEWLGDGNAMEGVPQEEVTSITLAKHCPGAGSTCAFAETSGQRIVELQMGKQMTGSGDPHWFPTRILQVGVDTADSWQGGALHLIGGQYLGILHAKKLLTIIDPQDGTIIGEWKLPDNQDWRSMCSMGTNLYFLPRGYSPQLWRFPLPESVQPRKLKAPQSDERQGKAIHTAALHSHQRVFLKKQQQAMLATS
mmetsp:Transcript_97453/g.271081  ORF Transcript_97453/g.271081 Transcript_97453/m.271081 type:complete len:889 (-) Transcript_97453:334-3000(-)|eukprot:CAMPEP_0179046802 /NCGR_PEP_ID=MMETSP0796-20121207/18873_1 /TAXON_ID=73915 /ORGANISM="Pyrodinium bahamense, Strain pbaha01" /LENGTH=888 /DNA_ID=CAMNT_0020743235 /DNA_START=29 /DNA_END=2695 /DNA_ORIENTATION=-